MNQFLLTRLSRGVTYNHQHIILTGKFLLTRLSRGVTCAANIDAIFFRFLLTRLSRGVTYPHAVRGTYEVISTHTPLARRDALISWLSPPHEKFLLTRLSRGVTPGNGYPGDTTRFLLTRLSRGVTRMEGKEFNPDIISTHTPLARRDKEGGFAIIGVEISTHTPLARRDGGGGDDWL